MKTALAVRPEEKRKTGHHTANASESRSHHENIAGAPAGMPLFLQGSFLPGAGSAPAAKLTVGRPDDALEHEADRVADAVLNSQAGSCHCGGTCSDCQQQGNNTLQRKPESASYASPAAPSAASGLDLGPGQPLSQQTRAFFEPRFGQDFSGVRVHTGPQAEESARHFRARAFTVGRDVAFAPGWNPETESGRRLLGHELAHVVQQGEGTQLVQRMPEGDSSSDHVPSNDQGEEEQQAYHFNVERLTEEEFREITGLPSAILSEGDFTDARDLTVSSLPEGSVPPGLVTTDQPEWLSQTANEGPSEFELGAAIAGSGMIRVPFIGSRAYTPQQMFDILANDLAWSFNRGGPPVYDPKLAGSAAGGRGAGRSVFAIVQVTDRFGNRVDVALGQHLVSRGLVHTPAHAEPQALQALEHSNPRLGEVRGGKMTVVVNQLPCGPGSQNCAGALRAFAQEHGLGLEVYVPERPDLRPGIEGRSVSPRTATKSSMRADLPILENGKNYRVVPLEDLQVPPGEVARVRPARPWRIAGESPAAGRGAVAFIRYGGAVLTVYSAYGSTQRLYDAWNRGSDAFVPVLVEETAAWVGGSIGADVGGQVARYACVYTGPFALACTVVMSLGGAWVGAKVGGWIAEAINNIINVPETLRSGFKATGEVLQAMGLASRELVTAPGEFMVQSILRSYESLNPENWDLRYLPPSLVDDVKEVGRTIWASAGSAKTLDEFLSVMPTSMASFDLESSLIERIASELTALEKQVGSDVVYTASELLDMSPTQFIQLLEKRRLRHVVDPEYLAGFERTEDNEAYLRFYLAPLIRQRASINEANWNLDHLAAIEEKNRILHPDDDLYDLGSIIWQRLGGLDQWELERALAKPLAELSVPSSLMENISFEVQTIIQSQGFGGSLGLEYILPPEVLLQKTPLQLVEFLMEWGIIRFRREPSQIAKIALKWVRMGYQPW